MGSEPLEVEHHWLNAGRDFQFIRQHLQDARAAFFLNPMDEVSFRKSWAKIQLLAPVFWDLQKKPCFSWVMTETVMDFGENGGLVGDFLLNIYIAW